MTDRQIATNDDLQQAINVFFKFLNENILPVSSRELIIDFAANIIVSTYKAKVEAPND